MAVGFFNRFRRTPAATAGVPPVQPLVNAKNNANTQVLSNALKNYVKSIRNLRNQNPFGLSRNALINQTVANRNKINRAIANYVMNVNKAKYMNGVARQAIPAAQTGAVPESAVVPIVAAATRQNNETARAAQQVQQQIARPQAPINVNAAIRNKNFSQLNTVNLMVGAANKVKNSNNTATKNAYVNFIGRQIPLYETQANKNRLQAAINKVSPTNNSTRLTTPNEKRQMINILKEAKNENFNNNISKFAREVRGAGPSLPWKNLNETPNLSEKQKELLKMLKTLA